MAANSTHGEEPNVKEGIETIELGHWTDFTGYIADKMAEAPAYVYRGQTDAAWPIDSSLDRYEKLFPNAWTLRGGRPENFDAPASRDVHLRAFRQAIRGRYEVNPATLSDDACWALAQHHGLVTPLLDWTFSPFVALYFAFEDEYYLTTDRRACTPESRVVFALSSSVYAEGATEDDPPPRLFSPTSETSERLIAQSGLFLKMPKGCDLEGYVRRHFSNENSATNGSARAVLKKIVIKNDGRIGCLKMLNKMNINRMTLFPDLDGASRYINSLWETDFDTSLGYIPDAE